MMTIEDNAAVRRMLGIRIRTLRKQCGKSQNALAQDSGVNRSYLAGVESGVRNVSVDNLICIAFGLDVTLSELFEGVVTEPPKRDGG